jgi:hypothetical protein
LKLIFGKGYSFIQQALSTHAVGEVKKCSCLDKLVHQSSH